ncbi:glutamine--tRNA ligase/YqeY domain fusion protein [Robertmurraya yapensis]|uniref:Glutamine--tRNA ligase n=1 Tax=Bacillus yapensis TaxID=2492960 RepID=A0A431VYQ0_9BACI|nr:glutamine--tRNA ligase/YqeY domain fusion protein [Bacillus yapensis]RTR28402.1 glutamine--tRNA ligase/YqeY domain fusion protein [Bacillus yapensis]TKS94463.1 glutamine--tRNA ligase/YqeY domain fusion protein [Bacillus yapensis]
MEEKSNSIERIIEEDMENGVFSRVVCTRFPPEPNGHLHIGSAYAINMNYMVAQKFKGRFNLRFDDTNPLKEDIEYVNSIIKDMKWLGYDPGDRVFYGSDYSDEIFEAALKLIKKGKAYVCELSPEDTTKYRGTLTEPGKNSPFRDRTIEENLELFKRMKNGDFSNGSMVLRAKIDMASPNINLRDPILYRIIHAEHYRTGNKWCIYPMYDFAHPIQDALEGITHSLCSIEFKDHRPLYEWVLNELEIKEPPKQREFGRVNITGVVTSKRYLRELVEGNFVEGWDDPRLPTLGGLRRRGFTPESIRTFVNDMGFVRHQSVVDFRMLEQVLRDELKTKVNSVMAVLNPLKVTITNYDETELLPIENNKENPDLGTREVLFSNEIYIEKEDFMEVPVKGFKRLSLDTEVRLKGAYIIRCHEVVKDDSGEIIELKCTYDPETKSGTGFTGRKVKGIIHWVSALNSESVEVNLYESLFEDDEIVKDKEKSWEEKINPKSKITMGNCRVESSITNANIGDRFQFFRHGYFILDKAGEKLSFNRIVSLKDSWKGKNG